MKTTVRGVILQVSDAEKEYLDDMMSRYCAAIRWGFKRLLDGVKTQQVRKMVQIRFGLNSRQANDAVFDAQSTIASQRKLVKLHYSNALAKVEFTKKRLQKAKSSRKISGLQKGLDKEERRLAKWQKHVDEGTFPPVVFGGKKLFYERCKGKITKEEWQAARNNRYLSRGDKTKGGNLNTRLTVVNGVVSLEIAAKPVETSRTIRYNRIKVPVYLAHKPSQKTGKINGRNYRQMVLEYLKTGQAYQVEILRKDGRYYIHITIEETPAETYNPKGAVGVDTNPDGLGVTLLDYLGQFRDSKWFSQGEWTYAKSNRRSNLIGEMATNLVALAKEKESSLVVEDLNFKQDKAVSKKFNRISHGFIWSKFLEQVERRESLW